MAAKRSKSGSSVWRSLPPERERSSRKSTRCWSSRAPGAGAVSATLSTLARAQSSATSRGSGLRSLIHPAHCQVYRVAFSVLAAHKRPVVWIRNRLLAAASRATQPDHRFGGQSPDSETGIARPWMV